MTKNQLIRVLEIAYIFKDGFRRLKLGETKHDLSDSACKMIVWMANDSNAFMVNYSITYLQ